MTRRDTLEVIRYAGIRIIGICLVFAVVRESGCDRRDVDRAVYEGMSTNGAGDEFKDGGQLGHDDGEYIGRTDPVDGGKAYNSGVP